MSKYKFDINIFDNINTEEKAYWLGVLYADGYNQEERSTLRLSLSLKDKELIYKFKDFLGINKEPKIYQRKNKTSQPMIIIDATNHYFSQQLAKLGMMQAKTFKLTFPLFLKKELIHHFLRGYFDGDGSIWYRIVKKGYRPTFGIGICSTKTFVEYIKNNILVKYNINCCIYKRWKHKKNNNRQLSFGGNQNVEKFLNYLYKDATIFLQRKFDRFLLLKKINKIKYKQVEQYDLNSNLLNVFNSTRDAAKKLNSCYISIESICNGSSKRKTHKGYIFKYAKNPFLQYIK